MLIEVFSPFTFKVVIKYSWAYSLFGLSSLCLFFLFFPSFHYSSIFITPFYHPLLPSDALFYTSFCKKVNIFK